ncbi:uncharacterized protein LOC116417075 [Nasonia vitripennis]|uniref:Uncharacterized protein n=1 Tax=Nasonia vitripennis TaxID=7425 RepID=A0A7M7QBE2_NASVI|nr:uncharacterized protein LOC116417075 [Nasonia vitripennis]
MSDRQALLNNMADLQIRNGENANLNGGRNDLDPVFEVENDIINGEQQNLVDPDFDVEMKELQELEDINPQNHFVLQGPLHGQFAGRRPLLGIDAARNAQGHRQNQQNAIIDQVPLVVGQGAADEAQGPLQNQQNSIIGQVPLVVGQGAANRDQRLLQAQRNRIGGQVPLVVGQGAANRDQRLLQVQRNGLGGQGLPDGAEDLWQAQNNDVAGPLQRAGAIQRAGAGARRSMQGQHNNNNGQRPPQPQREAINLKIKKQSNSHTNYN